MDSRGDSEDLPLVAAGAHLGRKKQENTQGRASHAHGGGSDVLQETWGVGGGRSRPALKMKSVAKRSQTSSEYYPLSGSEDDQVASSLAPAHFPPTRATYHSRRHRSASTHDYDDLNSSSSGSHSSSSDEDERRPSKRKKSAHAATLWLLAGLTVTIGLVVLIAILLLQSNGQLVGVIATAGTQFATATATGSGAAGATLSPVAGTSKGTTSGGPTKTSGVSSKGGGDETPSATGTTGKSTATSNVTNAAPEGGLSEATIKLLQKNLDDAATDSWVAGTYAQVLLELASFSPFTTGFDPLSSSIDPPTSVISLIAKWSASRPSNGQMASTGSAADPASLGVGWIVAVQAGKEEKSGVESELTFLMDKAPKSEAGAISHRSEDVQLWADFVYMVPPFLAYHGLVYADKDVLLAGYTQCKLYRDGLQDDSTKLWRHIEGVSTDGGLWGTGNAWAAAGMARVLATILASSSASTMTSQVSDLAKWIDEILVATFAKITDTDLLPNYYDSDSFTDAASSALLAAASFRLAHLGQTQDEGNLAIAERIRLAVNKSIGDDGWVKGCVDPINWHDETDQSPESMTFVLLLQVAWSDYQSTK